jgi:nitrite reductase/ring-hydroxylating ferredoxin subunit
MKMGFFTRILGICKTQPPLQADCWSFKDGKVHIDLSKAPELAASGGAIRLEGKALPVRVLVLRSENDRLRAFKNKCTHMGRRLDPLPDSSEIRCCSVSKSTFDENGKCVSGPVQEALTPFEVTVKADQLEIDIKWK